MKRKLLTLALLLSLCTIAFTSCNSNTPPSINAVQNQLDKNLENIQIVVDFLENSEYKNIYITKTDGSMVADLSEEEIPDSNVLFAVKQLLGDNQYYKICKVDNTIYILLWKGLRDIGCGIAYTINGADFPVIEYSTELIPLSTNGWYYYVSDYELQRQGTVCVNPIEKLQ